MTRGSVFGILITLFVFCGCQKMIAVGEIETFCQENGSDYSDAGWCESPYEIMQNRDNVLMANQETNRRMKCQK